MIFIIFYVKLNSKKDYIKIVLSWLLILNNYCDASTVEKLLKSDDFVKKNIISKV